MYWFDLGHERRCDVGHHLIARWFLGQTELDINVSTANANTALYAAICGKTSLDIVVWIAKLSSLSTLNQRNSLGLGLTALDIAVQLRRTSAALYLSWLGAECKEKNKNCYFTGFILEQVNTYTEVTIETWIEAGCQQDAQFWAVAANDINALKHLVDVECVKLDRPKLSNLAKLFDHRAMWSYVTRLKSLAWDRIKQTVPAVDDLSPEDLMEGGVPGPVAGVLVTMRNAEPEPELYESDSDYYESDSDY